MATTRVVKLELFLNIHTFFVIEFNQQYLFLQNLKLLRLVGSCNTLKHAEKLKKISCLTTIGMAIFYWSPCISFPLLPLSKVFQMMYRYPLKNLL